LQKEGHEKSTKHVSKTRSLEKQLISNFKFVHTKFLTGPFRCKCFSAEASSLKNPTLDLNFVQGQIVISGSCFCSIISDPNRTPVLFSLL
jgi:hypothetical protein